MAPPGWIYSHEHGRRYRQEYINGRWQTIWEGENTVDDEPADLPRGEGLKIEGSWRNQQGQLHYERLDSRYHVRDSAFFVPGRVFSILFTEPVGITATTSYNPCISEVQYGEQVYSNIRRFVVVRQRVEFCFACPIFTYSGRATTKRGVRPQEHAIIHTEGYLPTLVFGEEQLQKRPIAVEAPQSQHDILDHASRIYFGIHHPIQYNVKVKDLGMVCEYDIPNVVGYWQEEQMKDMFSSRSDAPPLSMTYPPYSD